MNKFSSKLLSKHTVAESTVEFRFSMPQESDFVFIAGQYIGIGLSHLVAPDSLGSLKCFSLVNSPTDNYLAAVMRLSLSGFKKTLDRLTIGATVMIEGPYGQFTLHSDLSRPAIFIAGGVGIAPVVSILKDLRARKEYPSITVLYCNTTPQRIAYQDELAQLSQDLDRLKVHHLLSTGSVASNSYKRLNKELLMDLASPYINAVYYVVGKPDFVYDISDMLSELEVSEESIKSESFAGY